MDGLTKSESHRPPNRPITGATTGVLSASTKRKRSGRQGAPCLCAIMRSTRQPDVALSLSSSSERRFMQIRMAVTLPSWASWTARLAMFSAAPSSKSRGCASPAAGQPDFRFGLSEIGAFSSLLCWFWGLGVRPENASVWAPALGAPKNQDVFGVPRLRAMKNPARFPGPGLGALLKDIFLYLSPVSTSRSHKLQVTSCTEITSCTTHRLYSASQEVLLRPPSVGVRPMKDPARFTDRGWIHFSSVLFCT